MASLHIELRNKLAAVIKKQDALIEQLIKENRDATAEEEELSKSFDAEKARLQRAVEKLLENRQMISSEADVIEERATAAANTVEEKRTVEVRVGRQEGEDENGNYRPFKTLGEQLQVIARAASNPHAVDKRLLELNKRANGMNEGVGADGGYAVQTDFASEIMKAGFDTGLLTSRCRRFPTSAGSNGFVMNCIDETSRTNGSRWGGVQVYWVGEGETVTPKRPKLSRLELKHKKLMGIAYATDELLADATALGSVLGQAFEEEFAYAGDEAVLNGSGVGEPLGILQSAALIKITKEQNQTAAQILGANILNMRNRMMARSRPNAVWLINQELEPQLQAAYITGSKSDQFLYQFANGNGTFDRLYGLPIIIVEQCKAMGTAGDIVLADFSNYGLIDKGPMDAQTSMHVAFLTDELCFRFVARADGQPLVRKAITPANGTKTVSPFIAIETR